MSERFEVAFMWEIEEGVGIPLRVFGTRRPYVPETRTGHPDTWTPAEGGELEDLRVFCGTRMPAAIENRLLADKMFVDRVAAAL